ncbi:hypothetical protein AVEN_48629-1 [Araneus ventricosus]|uniref:Uncharacterized protein n=1 Tax=Araneus ventricosus TaxID=182803 RepID=A0A4Y2IZX7_ARAVE|nr:hypothetical protein AVEN_48629-1 [Araneus ventricosus]
MGKQLSFVVKLSLEEMALRRVVVNLWTEADVLDTIEKLLFGLPFDEEDILYWNEIDQLKFEIMHSNQWREINEAVEAKVSELAISESLKKRMMHTVRPIGLEMLRWRLLFHEVHIGESGEVLYMHVPQLCWTSVGAVDFRKTAEWLVRLETLDVVKRFKLSCLYCLEDYISLLWEELPEAYKSRFNDLDDMYFIDTQTHLEFYWAYAVKGEESKLHYFVSRKVDNVSSLHKLAFEASARGGEKAATEYFLQKLTNEERDSFLFEIVCTVALGGCVSGVPKEKYSDVLCYLLCVMTPAEKVQILNRDPGNVLGCLLDWPWQDLFLDIADLTWTFLPKTSYCNVLSIISERIKHTGYYFPNVLQEFFLRSPSDFRKLFAFNFDAFFSPCSCVPETETLEVIFRNIDLGDKTELVSSSGFSKLLRLFVVRGEWHIVEVCLREVLLSKEDCERLRKSFLNCCGMIQFRDCSYDKSKFDRFYELLDRTEASAPFKARY